MKFVEKACRVVVGISGGVDSAVAAFMLKKQKYDVVGVYMKNWDSLDETGFCNGEQEAKDAEEVCSILNIPFYEVNFVREYWTEVFDDFIADYTNGLTPNPDILCNKNVKFKHFLNVATRRFEADAIATGHYARKCYTNDGFARLLKARDLLKDQTFFLSQIPQHALKKTLFPLGDFFKYDVKRIAKLNELGKFADKKESYGICFIGRRKFQEFISEYILPEEGFFIDVDNNKIVGKHNGKHNYTVGQRCKIGGAKEAYYVAEKRENGDIMVALGHDHLAHFRDRLVTAEPVWVRGPPDPQLSWPGGRLRCQFRFQHRKPLVGCLVARDHGGGLDIALDTPLRALTPGQYAVLYHGPECLGSARIISALPHLEQIRTCHGCS